MKNLLTKSQFGLRSDRSADQAVAALLLKINDLLNNGNYVFCIFCDIKKAFDARNLSSGIPGIPGRALDLIRSHHIYEIADSK